MCDDIEINTGASALTTITVNIAAAAAVAAVSLLLLGSRCVVKTSAKLAVI